SWLSCPTSANSDGHDTAHAQGPHSWIPSVRQGSAMPPAVPRKVSLLVTCLGDALFPEVGVATVRLLRRLGVEVGFPAAETCCGQPHFNSGYSDDARELARHTIRAFAGDQQVVAPSGSCTAMVKLEYPELLHEDRVWGPRAEDLARRTHDLSDFLVN